MQLNQLGEKSPVGGLRMNEKQILLWKYLYSTLTTSQINSVLRQLDLTWTDWMDFCEMMRGDVQK